MISVPTPILVVDIEATCWQGNPPPGQESEIIEVGLCLLDTASGQPREKRSILVRPQRSRVSPFCTRLTTLTQADVDQGISFGEACTILENQYHSKRRIWASYGNYDRQQFQRDCAASGVPYPFSDHHINVKALFAKTHGLRRRVGMARALKMLNLPLAGTHHRGHDDAWNIAHILAILIAR